MNYDFWYQPRKNMLVSSEFGAPNAFEHGFDLDDVAAGPLRPAAALLEPRGAHARADDRLRGAGPRAARDPLAARPRGRGRVRRRGALEHDVALRPRQRHWSAEPVITTEGVELEGWPFPVPALITDLVLSMDDKALYFSNWLHGDLRRYDVSDPANPKLTGQALARRRARQAERRGRELNGGPQMLQLSLDGKRLYVTNSLYSTWDNQFYPSCVPGCCESTSRRRLDGGRQGLLRRLRRSPRRAGAGARGAAPGRRLHDGDLPVILAHHMGGEEVLLGSRPPAGRRPRRPASCSSVRRSWQLRRMAAPEASRSAGGGVPRRGGAPARRGRLAGVTTRKLAAEAGVNNGLVHYYFGSVENLLVRVLERFTERLIVRQRAMYADPDALRREVADGDALPGRGPRVPEGLVRAAGVSWNRPELQERVGRVHDEWRAVLTEAFAEPRRATASPFPWTRSSRSWRPSTKGSSWSASRGWRADTASCSTGSTAGSERK